MTIATTESRPQQSYALQRQKLAQNTSGGSGFSIVKSAITASMFVFLTETAAAKAVPKPWTVAPRAPSLETVKLPMAFKGQSVREQSSEDAIIQRTRELGAFPAGWHNNGSLPASSKAVEEAERFIRSIDWKVTHKPMVALADDGELNFVWSDATRHLDIGFVGDGTYFYYGRSADGTPYNEDAAPVGTPLPEALAALIRVDAQA